MGGILLWQSKFVCAAPARRKPYYNPLTDPATIKIDLEKAQNWIANGAQPTDTVKELLKKAGL